ncbi:hypothetical protein J1605_005274 [Eschrichtius robustus]|uniref:Uncharacterized protein n=1 Tax=Eschrichtius robustus TaxID=9764 RepID=A0AB34H9B8_ESCRO|nr:hypothetical protein J1605_005274 [Eschrichtius robustus]
MLCSEAGDERRSIRKDALGLIQSKEKISTLKIVELPWCRSGWESTCQCRGRGFGPWSGRIPHATGPLGLHSGNREPRLL